MKSKRNTPKIRACRPRTMQVARPFWTNFRSLPPNKDERAYFEAGWNDPACDYTLSGNADLRVAPDGSVWMLIAASVDELPDRSEVLPEGQLDDVFTQPVDCACCGHTVIPEAQAETACGKIVHEDCVRDHIQECKECQRVCMLADAARSGQPL